MCALLNVDKAIDQILEQITPLGTTDVPFRESLGRILAQDIASPIDVPGFAQSAMDGYAVRAEDVISASTGAPVMLRVVDDIPAGTTSQHRLQTGEAARIMTGAPLPAGADAVVPVEQTDQTWHQQGDDVLSDTVGVTEPVAADAYVRPPGENFRQGQRVITAGQEIRPAEIGIFAALGIVDVPVRRQPHGVVLSTGDELVEPDQPLTPGHIRDVNRYTIEAMLRHDGAVPHLLPCAADSVDAVRAMFQDAIARQPDMIISSAGVSVGTMDYVRTVVEELGSVGFWKINLRPGKPLAFGQVSGIPFFGLPGNPVSAMITYDVIVRPAVMKMNGRHDTSTYIQARLTHDLTSDGRRSYIRVTIAHTDDGWTATPLENQSSGAFLSMSLADGLLILPEGTHQASAGDTFQVRMMRELPRI